MRSRYIVVLLVGLVAGLAIGAVVVWSLRGDDERVSALEARIHDLESGWQDSVPTLEAAVERLTKEATALRARAEAPARAVAKAQVQELEAAWRTRFEVVESRLDALAKELAATMRRAEDLARVLAQARPADAVSGATPPARSDITRNQSTPVPSAALRVSGVIWRGDRRMALVEGGQNEGYLARVGSSLPEGRVVEINDDTVVIERKSGDRLTLKIDR